MKCKKCQEDYPAEDMPFGRCADCQDDFDSMDLEDRLEDCLNVG